MRIATSASGVNKQSVPKINWLIAILQFCNKPNYLMRHRFKTIQWLYIKWYIYWLEKQVKLCIYLISKHIEKYLQLIILWKWCGRQLEFQRPKANALWRYTISHTSINLGLLCPIHYTKWHLHNSKMTSSITSLLKTLKFRH